MSHRTMILLCVAMLVGWPFVGMALDKATRTRPARDLPRKLHCEEVRDPSVGAYWICGDRPRR